MIQAFPSHIQNIGQVIAERASQTPNKPFLIFPEKQQTITYQDLETLTAKTAHVLLKLGITHGDTVAILLPNIPEFLFFYWGAMRIGAIAAPINTLLKGPEIQYIVSHSEAKVLVSTGEFFETLAGIEKELPLVRHCIKVHDLAEPAVTLKESRLHVFENLLLEASEASSQFARVSKDDPAMIIYTSGTTGKPKGVLLTHFNLLVDAHYISQWFAFTSETRMLCILPLFHVNGEVVTMMTPLWIGGSVVLTRKFSASQFWQTLSTYAVNLFSTVPTILSILLNQGPHHGCNLSALQFGICGAAPLPVEVHKQFEAVFNIPIYEGYGLSETTCYSTFNPPSKDHRKIGSIGLAVGNEVAIWGENNLPVAVGQPGEIVVRGANVMLGYFKNQEATQQAFAGGWFHTGDYGRQDEEGFFYILDRVKDMIIRGGENIYPREIDEVLYQHPAIESAATIGVQSQKYGEDVKSFVVLKPGCVVTEETLLAFCKTHLADFKCPSIIVFIDEIPKGPTGKLLRRSLREN
jgi:long-chain acyl-CoA synthetase